LWKSSDQPQQRCARCESGTARNFSYDDGRKRSLIFGFDIDGDGKYVNISAVSPTFDVVYPTSYSGPVLVKVVDVYGCSSTATTYQTIEARDVQYVAQDSPDPESQLCGAGEDEIEPGERWSARVVLTNKGTIRTVRLTTVFCNAVHGNQLNATLYSTHLAFVYLLM
jgi:hypothetical protein